jgi:hypothetical protein
MLFPLTRDQLLPPGVPRLPKAIKEANEAAHDAFERWENAKIEAGRAGEKADAAPRFDQMAAEAALAAGEDSPSATVEAKRVRAQEARTHAAAAEQHAKQRVRELYDAVEDNLDAYVEPRRERAEQTAEPVRALVPEFLERLATFRVENELYRVVQSWHNNPNSASLSSTGHDPATHLRRQYEKARARQEVAPRRNAPVPNELPELLAAIDLHIEREIGAG